MRIARLVTKVKDIEWIGEDFYARTVHLGASKGWIKVTQAKKKNALVLEFAHSLTAVLPALLDARKSREGVCYDGRAEMIAAAGPVFDFGPGTRDGRLDSGFDVVCVRHLPTSLEHASGSLYFGKQ